jgi:hypothetical protein
MNVETEESWPDLKTANSRTTHGGKKSYMSFALRHRIKSTSPAADQYRLCALANVLFDQQLLGALDHLAFFNGLACIA